MSSGLRVYHTSAKLACVLLTSPRICRRRISQLTSRTLNCLLPDKGITYIHRNNVQFITKYKRTNPIVQEAFDAELFCWGSELSKPR